MFSAFAAKLLLWCAFCVHICIIFCLKLLLSGKTFANVYKSARFYTGKMKKSFFFYCCPVKLKRAKKSCPKPCKFRLRVFFSPK